MNSSDRVGPGKNVDRLRCDAWPEFRIYPGLEGNARAAEIRVTLERLDV